MIEFNFLDAITHGEEALENLLSQLIWILPIVIFFIIMSIAAGIVAIIIVVKTNKQSESNLQISQTRSDNDDPSNRLV